MILPLFTHIHHSHISVETSQKDSLALDHYNKVPEKIIYHRNTVVICQGLFPKQNFDPFIEMSTLSVLRCHHDHALFLAERDTIFNDLFHPTAFQSFHVFFLLNLSERFTASRLQIPIIRILQFDDHTDSVRRLDGNITVILPGLRV